MRAEVDATSGLGIMTHSIIHLGPRTTASLAERREPFLPVYHAGSLSDADFSNSVSTAGLWCAQSAAQAAFEWFVFVPAATADASAPAGRRGGDTAFREE